MASILSRLQPDTEPNRPSAIKQIVEDFRSFIASFPSFRSMRIGRLTSRIEHSQAVGPLLAATAESNATPNGALWYPSTFLRSSQSGQRGLQHRRTRPME